MTTPDTAPNEITAHLAYLLVTTHDVARHRDLPATLASRLGTHTYYLAAEYALRTGCVAASDLYDEGPTLVNWSDLDDVLRHAHRTITDALAEGWLPADATAPF